MPVQLFEKTENKRRMNKNVITNEIKKKTIPSDKSFRRREFSSKRKDTIKSID